MIVDAHVHGFPSREVLGNAYERLIKERRESYFQFYRGLAWMHTAGLDTAENEVDRGLVDNLIANMNTSGIDKVVIANMYPDPIEWKVAMMKEYPERIYAYAGVDPNGGKEAVKELERQASIEGIVGAKFGPPYQEFYPNDPKMYPLYEKAVDLEIPIAFHTGWAPGKARLKYAHPIHLDDVAVDFPQLTIIGCHMGAGWFNDFANVATKNPNIYADFSGCLEYTSLPELISPLERLVRFIGADRILLGSDYPIFRFTTFLEIARSLRISDEDKRKILGENAGKLFKIT